MLEFEEIAAGRSKAKGYCLMLFCLLSPHILRFSCIIKTGPSRRKERRCSVDQPAPMLSRGLERPDVALRRSSVCPSLGQEALTEEEWAGQGAGLGLGRIHIQDLQSYHKD